ncbi:hypothetical protein OB919_10150 [Halobacteria archaeon AArc-curdl1]|uniref:Uncharacterized protein n=1 Tax=Natronosalvus hydrolyticus TaxID=2979988 RepID=A0AAP2Z8U5_9EURY|nr:hypothetical protein [Halobacteria archaeon AArc-curdl1]
MESVRSIRCGPVACGAVIGLLTGTIGLVIAPALALVGAIGRGVSASALSDEGIVSDTINAGLADLLSSGVVYVLFFAFVAWSAGELLTAFLAVAWMQLYTLPVAVIIGTISLAIALVSGLCTTVVHRRFSSHKTR